ncbi:MAG: CpXC domain-containing protein, partial [Anaerolineales bacterium]
MPPAPTTIRCPNCKSPIQAPIEQLLDVGRDPGAKARLLSGSLNRVRCPVCGFNGQVGSPLVYHDPAKELLLTYLPVELGLPQAEQERVIGALINQAIQGLPAERRKAYLFQPQPTLTLASLVERVLSADGITHEELESQRSRLRLLEDLLRIEPDRLQAFVAEHDPELDEAFFQLASLALEGTPEGEARQAALGRLDAALELSSTGKHLKARQDEVRAAVESLRAAGEGLTRQKLLALFLEAPNADRMDALASLTRPALDYSFFQILSERIDAAAGEEKARLTDLRTRLLDVTRRIDQVQQARVG